MHTSVFQILELLIDTRVGISRGGSATLEEVTGTPEHILSEGTGNKWEALIGCNSGVQGWSSFRFLQVHI